MNDDLKAKCEKTFYSELYHFEETSQGLLIDETTGHIYLKKTLDVYDKDVYGWLKSNRNVHIPAIHSFWEDNGKLIVLEEYIQGETLETLLGRGSLNETERIRIILDVCDALSFLHSARIPIIHRDIKPSNIMLTSDGIVKLIDYDAAKVFHQGKKEDTTLIGTVGRAAPEQYGFAQSDARTDVYSMGLLIGEVFPNDRRFFAIIAKATVMDPKGRYQTMAELKAAVHNAVANPAGKKKRAWVIIPVVGFVFILCLASFFIGLRSGRVRGSDRIEPAPEKLTEKTENAENTLEEDIAEEDIPEENIPEENAELQDSAISDPEEEPLQQDTGEVYLSQETDASTEDSGLTIGETCWFISGSSTDGFVHYGVVLENTNKSRKIVFPTVRVTARDKSGRILGTDEMTGMDIMPGDHIALANLVSLPDVDSFDDISVDFAVASGETGADNGEPRSSDFTVERISDNEDEMFPNVTGEITSSYKETINVALTALFRNKGKLVACDTTYLNYLAPGVPTAFEIDLITDVPKHDSVDIMVQNW